MLWEKSYLQQERFIEINLKQNNDIFRLVIGMIIFGLLLICAGLTRDFLYPLATISSFSWVAIIAGLVTQFIAATILVVFRTVFQQTMEYFRTVERMASIEFAINILDNLPAGQDAKDSKTKTLPEIAVMIIERQLGMPNQTYSALSTESHNKIN